MAQSGDLKFSVTHYTEIPLVKYHDSDRVNHIVVPQVVDFVNFSSKSST